MRVFLFIGLILGLVNCSEHKSEQKVEMPSKRSDTNFYLINSFGCISRDTSKFVKISCGLYTNNRGLLAYKAVDNSYRMDTTGNSGPLDIYLTTIYYADRDDSINGGLKEMRYVIDTATFRILGSFYFKDKNHVYDFNPMSDGGTVAINWDADAKSFQVLASDYYAKDKRNCYYRGRVIKGADLSSFRVLDTSYSWNVAYDGKRYYSSEDIMDIKDVKQYNLDSIRKKNGM